MLADDMGYGDLSCHGNPVLKTPNLDRLRAESVRFVDFHAAPMCTPARGQLLTGLDALRNGATSVTAGRSFLRPGLSTMPDVFAAAGWRTAIFGKWHLGDSYPHRPNDRGFQEAVYHKGWGFTSAPEFANTLFDGRYFHNGVEKRFKGYCTDFWFDEAMKWMRARREQGEPFLCYLPTNAPHAPHIVDKKYSDPYEGKGPAAFFGMIANLDENVGRLEAFLRETGLRENTIILFMSDNGGTAGVKLYNAGMRGHKTEYYEGGHRAPCFVRWPAGRLGSPRDTDAPAHLQDLMPTLLDLTGVPVPAGVRFDGLSLAGLLRGTAEALPDRLLVVQYGQIPKKWDSAVIWGRWRLVKGEELYDIKADPGQEKNVAADEADVLARMREHYEKWWARIEPQLPDFVTLSLGAEKENPVALTSSDWEAVYADNSNHIRQAAGGPRGGAWNVFVEREGDYEIALRRWPREADLPLGADSGPQSKAFPIAAARVTVAGQNVTGKTAPTEKEVVLRARLPRGKTRLQAWFADAQGQDLCGAFYAYVRRQ
jgi:arylsulfatase